MKRKKWMLNNVRSRDFLLIFAATFAAAFGVLASGASTLAAFDSEIDSAATLARATGSKPNVVFILADDLGYGDVSCFGQTKFSTPNVDRLAAEGMKFSQFYSGATVCAPSRCSLFSGKHGGRAYIRGNREYSNPSSQEPLSDEVLCFTETAKNAGYLTGVFGKWGLGHPARGGAPSQHGVDKFFGYYCQAEAHTYYPTELWRDDELIALDGTVYSPDLIEENALRFIRESAAAGKPFCCLITSTLPHAAMDAPEELVAPWRENFPEFEKKVGKYAGKETRNPIAQFPAMVGRLDATVGKTLDLLDELGLAEETIVVFTSDNGPHREGGHDPDFWNSSGGLRGGKRDLYEGGIRVPFVVRWKGTVEAGVVSDFQGAFWDVFPTVCDLIGAETPVGLDGVSFLPTLCGDRDAQENRPGNYLYWEFHEQGGKVAARRGNWKAVRRDVGKNPNGPIELYDLATDLAEQNDVAAEHSDVVREFEQIFDEAHSHSDLFPFSYEAEMKKEEKIESQPVEKKKVERVADAFESTDKECDVLIDVRHAFDFSQYPLTVRDVSYHRIYSYYRAFDYLKRRGVRVERYESDAPLDAETLARCKTLFLNLPSADKEPFLVSEVVAIKEFVENGGAAFFIVDHTNCYFHSTVLKPLFNELELETQTCGVCDATQNIGGGFGWIYCNGFSQHPITKGLKRIALQTGGSVDSRWGVVWSGENSWRDAAIMPIYGETDVGFYGNFIRDRDEEVGPQAVALAKDFGRGKIVVVGDQNMFSAFFLNYFDNYRLWLNAFAWILDRPELADANVYRRDAAELSKGRSILCWEDLTPGSFRFGDPDERGYYRIYSNICRYYNAFCGADDDWDFDLAILAVGNETYSQETLTFAVKQLKRGKALIVLDPNETVLTDAKSLISNVLNTLKESGVEPTTPIAFDENAKKARGDFVGGGRLTLLRGDASFDNTSVPTPESLLTSVQKRNVDALLKEIDAAFVSDAD